MLMFQDGVQVFSLPEKANCVQDEEKRSPLDLEECPCGYAVCTGDCCYYSEEKDPDIVIRVLNSDGFEMIYGYQNLDELQEEWDKEEGPPMIPTRTDRLLYGRVGDTEIHGETAEDVFKYLKETCGWNY